MTRRAGKIIKPGMLVIHHKWAEKGYVPVFVLSVKSNDSGYGFAHANDEGHGCDIHTNLLIVDKAGDVHIRSGYWCSCCLDVLSE